MSHPRRPLSLLKHRIAKRQLRHIAVGQMTSPQRIPSRFDLCLSRLPTKLCSQSRSRCLEGLHWKRAPLATHFPSQSPDPVATNSWRSAGNTSRRRPCSALRSLPSRMAAFNVLMRSRPDLAALQPSAPPNHRRSPDLHAHLSPPRPTLPARHAAPSAQYRQRSRTLNGPTFQWNAI
jgi:hypothetical protein